MAKTELLPGIASISGTIRKKNGERVLCVTRTDRNGNKNTRVYLRHDSDYKRKTPLSQKERNARSLFSMRAEYANACVKAGIPRKQAWDEARKKFPTNPL
jgi:hypothetical protein